MGFPYRKHEKRRRRRRERYLLVVVVALRSRHDIWPKAVVSILTGKRGREGERALARRRSGGDGQLRKGKLAGAQGGRGLEERTDSMPCCRAAFKMG